MDASNYKQGKETQVDGGHRPEPSCEVRVCYEYMWCRAMVVGREWVSRDQRGNYVLKLAVEIEVVKESRA